MLGAQLALVELTQPPLANNVRLFNLLSKTARRPVSAATLARVLASRLLTPVTRLELALGHGPFLRAGSALYPARRGRGDVKRARLLLSFLKRLVRTVRALAPANPAPPAHWQWRAQCARPTLGCTLDLRAVFQLPDARSVYQVAPQHFKIGCIEPALPRTDLLVMEGIDHPALVHPLPALGRRLRRRCPLIGREAVCISVAGRLADAVGPVRRILSRESLWVPGTHPLATMETLTLKDLVHSCHM